MIENVTKCNKIIQNSTAIQLQKCWHYLCQRAIVLHKPVQVFYGLVGLAPAGAADSKNQTTESKA